MNRNAAQDLHARLLAAHARGEQEALIALYTEAGEAAEADGRIDAACFHFTHAYVFALETGNDAARPLHARLCTHGREEPVGPARATNQKDE